VLLRGDVLLKNGLLNAREALFTNFTKYLDGIKIQYLNG